MLIFYPTTIHNCEEEIFRLQESLFEECSYKCNAFVRLSNPGFVPSDMGSSPVSILSAKSSQYSLDRLPSDAGMGPLNLLEFKALHEEYNEKKIHSLQWYVLDQIDL